MTVPAKVFSALTSVLFQLLPFEAECLEDRVIYRKHWMVLLRAIFGPALAIIAVLSLWTFLISSDLLWLYLSWGWLAWFGIVASLAPLLWLVWRYEDWRNDYYVVTDERIIDVVQRPFGFGTEIREAPLSTVQNVTMRIPNLLAASLDFGDIQVETAGKEGQLVFYSIAHPRRVQRDITQRVEAERTRRLARERAERQEEMLDWFSAYDELEQVTVVSHPPRARVGKRLQVEWRVAGRPGEVETCLWWDIQSRPERDYAHHTKQRKGSSGNYTASFTPTTAGTIYLAAWARTTDWKRWSGEYAIPVEE